MAYIVFIIFNVVLQLIIANGICRLYAPTEERDDHNVLTDMIY